MKVYLINATKQINNLLLLMSYCVEIYIVGVDVGVGVSVNFGFSVVVCMGICIGICVNFGDSFVFRVGVLLLLCCCGQHFFKDFHFCQQHIAMSCNEKTYIIV